MSLQTIDKSNIMKMSVYFHSKGINKMKIIYEMGENIHQPFIW